eukprot:gene10863-7529_t
MRTVMQGAEVGNRQANFSGSNVAPTQLGDKEAHCRRDVVKECAISCIVFFFLYFVNYAT